MQIKRSSEIIDSEIWKLSNSDDVILTKKGSDEQGVLINYKTYKAIKEELANRTKFNQQSHSTDSFNLNPFLQDFIDILTNDEFEDITDDDFYFENFLRKLKSGE